MQASALRELATLQAGNAALHKQVESAQAQHKELQEAVQVQSQQAEATAAQLAEVVVSADKGTTPLNQTPVVH